MSQVFLPLVAGALASAAPSGPTPIFFAPLTNSLIPTTAGNPTFTFSRATTAYVADNQGVLRQAVANEARFAGARRVWNRVGLNTQDFSGWTKSSTTAVFGATGPTGLPDASTVTGTVPTAVISSTAFGIVTGNIVVNSMWLRRRAGTGVISLRNTNGVNIDITAALDGTWKRFATPPVSATASGIGIHFAVGGDQVDATYAQIEDVTGQSNQAPSEYVSNGVLSAPYHGNAVPGIKYFSTTNGNSVTGNVVTESAGVAIPAASLLGFVAENAATNILPRSQEFDNAAWTKENATAVNTTAVAAPDGTLTADIFTDDAVSGFHRVYTPTLAVASGNTPYSFSVYIKAGTLTWVQLIMAAGIWGNFNIQTGALGFKGVISSQTTSITALPNGWYRCTLSFLSNIATTTPQIESIASDINSANPPYVGSSQTMYLWGAQVETGSDCSSYIPTTTGPVSRVVDVLSYAVPTNMDTPALTAYAETYMASAFTSLQQTVLRQGTAAQTVQYFDTPTKALNCFSPQTFTANARVIGAVNKSAAAWGGGTISLCLNGGTVAAGTSPTFATTGVVYIGHVPAVSQGIQGSVRNIRFYNVRLTNVELQTLTA